MVREKTIILVNLAFYTLLAYRLYFWFLIIKEKQLDQLLSEEDIEIDYEEEEILVVKRKYLGQEKKRSNNWGGCCGYASSS
jgi:hypothetical protein